MQRAYPDVELSNLKAEAESLLKAGPLPSPDSSWDPSVLLYQVEFVSLAFLVVRAMLPQIVPGERWGGTGTDFSLSAQKRNFLTLFCGRPVGHASPVSQLNCG